ncbi:MAG: TetR/AcrR family transcriptional regulator [Dictyoglomus sp.]|nr:TetR/AcrR family transcriptional regulator [Dictyoglomus sp.]MDW8189206.1 TetR/AcrR family transcriptional regulator [Dictyoglomus sp.]
MKFFAEKPYSQVDIEDVAKECGVAKGSMYQYFENKKEMYFYSIEVATKRLLELMKNYDFENISLFDYIEKSFEETWDFVLKHPHEYTLLEKSAFYDDSPYREEIAEYYEKMTKDVLYNLVIKNQKAGFIRQDIPPEIVEIFIESSSWGLKRFFIHLIRSKGIKITDLSTEYIKDLQKQYIKLLKEGIENKDKA